MNNKSNHNNNNKNNMFQQPYPVFVPQPWMINKNKMLPMKR